MFGYLFWILLALLGIGVAAAAFALWDRVRDLLAQWLREMGWHKSVLMDALIRFDLVAGKVRARLFATTRQTGKVKIDETVYRLDQIDDAEVLAELRDRGLARRDVLNLMN
jgi:hypothetical protein